MMASEPEGQAGELVLEYEIDAPPEKVWRAVSVPGLREQWLPARDLAEPDPVSTAPGAEVRYRMRDAEPPFQESVVTFQLRPDGRGGTILTVVHGPADAGASAREPPAANANGAVLMRAA